ncbi:MAG: hypothetical protein RLZZ316_2648 [Bacteroidota bacterium]
MQLLERYGKYKVWLLAVLFFFVSATVAAQETPVLPDTLPPGIVKPELGPNDTIPVPAKIADGTLIPLTNLEWVWVTRPAPEGMKKRIAEWTRLRNAVYVTYPYARRAGTVLNEINYRLKGITDKEKRKKIIQSREKDLRKEFTEPLTNLSVYQGRVLMKLINRQTGNNCYEIIKEYKGGLTARFYQTVAFFFNSSLKQPYDAAGDDAQVEQIVLEVERMYGAR